MSSASSPNSTLEHDPYHLSSRYEINRIFRRILEDGILVRMQAKGSPAAVVTTLLAMDVNANRLIIDTASHEHINDALLRSGAASFETVIDQIKVQFSVDDIQPCTFETKPALHIPIPSAIRRIQRREFFRVRTPVNNPAICTVNAGGLAQAFDVYDISAGGISLLDTDLSTDFQMGAVLDHCSLLLPPTTTLTVALQVMRIQAHQLASGREVRKLGCAFMHLSGSEQTHIQQYSTQLERLLIARDRGLS